MWFPLGVLSLHIILNLPISWVDILIFWQKIKFIFSHHFYQPRAITLQCFVCRAAEDSTRLSLAGLSLSSVTAQVGKQIGVMSGGTGGQNKTTEQTKIHQPTLLHKRIYEKNLTVNNNVRIFFKASFFLPTLKIKAITQNTKVPVQLKCLNLHHRT